MHIQITIPPLSRTCNLLQLPTLHSMSLTQPTPFQPIHCLFKYFYPKPLTQHHFPPRALTQNHPIDTMTSKPDIIDISSDSISSESLMSPPSWNFPPSYSNSLNKKTQKKVLVDSSSSSDLNSMPSFVSSYHSSSEDEGVETKNTKNSTTSATSKGKSVKAVSKKGTSSAHVQTHSTSTPAKRVIVLGLASKQNWEVIGKRGKQCMPDNTGKGKRSMG